MATTAIDNRFEKMRQLTASQTNGVLADSFKTVTELPDSNEARMSKSVIQEELELRNPELVAALNEWADDIDTTDTQDDVVLRIVTTMDRNGRREP